MKHRHFRRAARGFLALAALCAPLVLRAQDSTKATQPQPLCWRGKPAPGCHKFVITELGFMTRAASTSSTYRPYAFDPTYMETTRDFGDQGTLEAGVMVNRSATTALGVTALLRFDSQSGNLGIKGRYRRWLNPQGLALDLGAGLATGVFRLTSDRHPLVIADAALNFADYGAVVTRLEVARVEGHTATGLLAGARLGSKPATIGTGALLVAYALIIASFANADF